MTRDEPILAPLLFQQSPQKASPGLDDHEPGTARSTLTSQQSGFTALTSVSRQHHHHCPSMAPSNVGSCAPVAQTMSVSEELKMRQSWAVGAVIEVFSSSAAKWYIAQVVQVGEKATAHMLTAQFVGDNGGILQKSMPRSDVQLAIFGSNTRQMPNNFQKVASESRPGEFSYQDSASGQKYQTKELAWQNYYQVILKSEQAQQLLRQSSLTAQPQPMPQPQAQQAKPAVVQPAPTMSLAPAPTMSLAPAPVVKVVRVESFASDLSFAKPYVAKPIGDPIYLPPVIRAASTTTPSTVGEWSSTPVAVTAATPYEPQTTGDLSSAGLPKKGAPFPGYGQSFAVGDNAGYEAYLASQGMA